MPKNTPSRIIDSREKPSGIIVAYVGSGGGGGVPMHDIANHTGTLADIQAPQFLKIDGSRPLVGNLSVDPGVTVDGVDLSDHVTQVNAHHNRQHSMLSAFDHALEAAQWQIVGAPALNTLGLLTPSADPGAAVAILRTDATGKVRLSTAEIVNDLFVGILDMGTNYIYEDASNLRVEGSKALRFAQSIGGANWTIYNAGGAQFAGSVDIVAGGDLSVAGSGAYAGVQVLFVDSSGGNVGINCTPDPQFALDVAGPARATYWIGPHAIQLKNVLFLAHFDGRYPLETNFSGETNGHMGQAVKATGGVVFRHGKFGKAVQIAPAATNLVANPSFESGSTGWTLVDANASMAAPFLTNPYGYYHTGAACMGLSNTVANEDDYMSFNVVGLAASTTYTISAWCRVVSFIGAALNSRGLAAYDLDSGGTLRTTMITAPADEWRRHIVTVTTTATAGSHTIQIRLYAPRGYVLWDAVQCEAGAVATPYLDGSLGGYSTAGVQDGSGHAWTGAPHASTSSRVGGELLCPTAGNIQPNNWTIMAWVNPAGLGGNQTILRANGAGSYIILRLVNGQLQGWAGTSFVYGGMLTANTWTHVAATHDGATLKLYINGVLSASGASSGFSGMPALMYVGCDGAADKLNGVMDDLCILERVSPPGELLSIYRSEAPVFAEASRYGFRATPNGLVWGDDEGLWMKDAAGFPVLGVYGGVAASKTWGGFAMAVGDMVFGRNAIGSSALMWSKATGKFGWYGGGNSAPQVEISTLGKVVAGGGTVMLGDDGISIFSSAGGLSTIAIDYRGIYLNPGGPRATLGVGAGSRILAGWSEIFEADSESYLDGTSTTRYMRPLVVRSVDGDAGWVEITAKGDAYTLAQSAKIIIAQGLWIPTYSSYGPGFWGSTRIIDLQADTIGLSAANVRITPSSNTAAVGAYAGKMKININGTDRWIPYYAS